jgi:uncharacterized membrane protein YphA (DoxX/SURF4 family)
MAKGQTQSLSIAILQWALALFLIASGIWAVQSDSGFFAIAAARLSGNEVAEAVYGIGLDKGLAGVLIIVLGIIEIIGGVFIIIDFFTIALTGTKLILVIVLIAWIVITVLLDILGSGGLLNGALKGFGPFLRWIHNIGLHLLVIGGLLAISRGKR